jgi:hypothetical protein
MCARASAEYLNNDKNNNFGNFYCNRILKIRRNGTSIG